MLALNLAFAVAQVSRSYLPFLPITLHIPLVGPVSIRIWVCGLLNVALAFASMHHQQPETNTLNKGN